MKYFESVNPKFIEAAKKLQDDVISKLAQAANLSELDVAHDLHKVAYEIADNLLRDLAYDCKEQGLLLVCLLASTINKILTPEAGNEANEEASLRWIMDAIGQIKYETMLDIALQASKMSTGDE